MEPKTKHPLFALALEFGPPAKYTPTSCLADAKPPVRGAHPTDAFAALELSDAASQEERLKDAARCIAILEQVRIKAALNDTFSGLFLFCSFSRQEE